MEIHNLRLAKYLTAGTAFLLLALGGGLWPFIWWEMYANGRYTPPTQVNRLQLLVTDRAGQQHHLRPMDLYTLDDDSSSQPAGHQLIQKTVADTDTPQQKQQSRTYLTRQVEFVLGTQVEQIEVWQHLWDVDFSQHPPLDINRPTQRQLVDAY